VTDNDDVDDGDIYIYIYIIATCLTVRKDISLCSSEMRNCKKRSNKAESRFCKDKPYKIQL